MEASFKQRCHRYGGPATIYLDEVAEHAREVKSRHPVQNLNHLESVFIAEAIYGSLILAEGAFRGIFPAILH